MQVQSGCFTPSSAMRGQDPGKPVAMVTVNMGRQMGRCGWRKHLREMICLWVPSPGSKSCPSRAHAQAGIHCGSRVRVGTCEAVPRTTLSRPQVGMRGSPLAGIRARRHRYLGLDLSLGTAATNTHSTTRFGAPVARNAAAVAERRCQTLVRKEPSLVWKHSSISSLWVPWPPTTGPQSSGAGPSLGLYRVRLTEACRTRKIPSGKGMQGRIRMPATAPACA